MTKRSRRRSRVQRQKGWSGGLTAYRYGVVSIGNVDYDLKSRITLAGSAAKGSVRIFRGERRKSVIGKLIDELRDWRFSPFEDEAALRHGIRSTLCLDGCGWHPADTEATSLVTTALTMLGAKRPSWAEGQPEHADSRDRCLQCGAPIEDGSGGKAFRFCSENCARAAFQRRDFERRTEGDRAYAAAQRIIKKTRTKARECAWCGEAFHPIREKSTQKCCSFSCAAKLRKQAGTITAFFTEPVQSICAFCGEKFLTLSPRAKYCSKRCSIVDHRMRKGRVPQNLKVHVFDHFVTMPVDASQRRLTPQAMDWLLMERGLRITTEVRLVT